MVVSVSSGVMVFHSLTTLNKRELVMMELLMNNPPDEPLPPAVSEYVLLQTRNSQTESWVVPAGVTRISVVIIASGYVGGGGLSYRNNITVTPGETLGLSFGSGLSGGTTGVATRLHRNATYLCVAYSGGVPGGTGGVSRAGGRGGVVASSINTGGGSGGSGQYNNPVNLGGGGAGGYRGDGGTASVSAALPTAGVTNSGSGSGARCYNTGSTNIGQFNGGSVGLHGIGSDGASAQINGAYNGNDGSISEFMCGGGSFTAPAGANGGIRIIWGDGRSFPDNAK